MKYSKIFVVVVLLGLVSPVITGGSASFQDPYFVHGYVEKEVNGTISQAPYLTVTVTNIDTNTTAYTTTNATGYYYMDIRETSRYNWEDKVRVSAQDGNLTGNKTVTIRESDGGAKTVNLTLKDRTTIEDDNGSNSGLLDGYLPEGGYLPIGYGAETMIYFFLISFGLIKLVVFIYYYYRKKDKEEVKN